MVEGLARPPRAARTAGGRSRYVRLLGGARPVAVSHLSAAAAAYDESGTRLRLLAAVLTTEQGLGEQLVVDTILEHEGLYALEDLAAGVYHAWDRRRGASRPADASSPSAALLRQVHDLPDDQRAALGLCKYGGHDYRSAAAVLGLEADAVAVLLGLALRSLTPRRPSW